MTFGKLLSVSTRLTADEMLDLIVLVTLCMMLDATATMVALLALNADAMELPSDEPALVPLLEKSDPMDERPEPTVVQSVPPMDAALPSTPDEKPEPLAEPLDVNADATDESPPVSLERMPLPPDEPTAEAKPVPALEPAAEYLDATPLAPLDAALLKAEPNLEPDELPAELRFLLTDEAKPFIDGMTLTLTEPTVAAMRGLPPCYSIP
jgi:hypothetical protein